MNDFDIRGFLRNRAYKDLRSRPYQNPPTEILSAEMLIDMDVDIITGAYERLYDDKMSKVVKSVLESRGIENPAILVSSKRVFTFGACGTVLLSDPGLFDKLEEAFK
jgi:hypothetical protein